MFTGIIEELGSVKSIVYTGNTAIGEFEAQKVLEGTIIGDSIAINGVCQTVTKLTETSFTVEISPATIKKTTMNLLTKSSCVNLERAMSLNGRLGGHLVQGHVSSTAEISELSFIENMYLLKLKIHRDQMKYVIDEGSITVDGISLTVSDTKKTEGVISIQVIPHTFRNTTLKYRKKGDFMNIETDMIGRFVESLITSQKNSDLTIDKLKKWGY